MKLFPFTLKIQRLHGQSGNVLAFVLGGIALSAILGITTFSLVAGPLRTIASVNKSSVAISNVQAITRIALMDAQNQTAAGDCDGDGMVELRNPREAATAATTPIEYVPNSLGAPVQDPWGRDYFYCTWDTGATFDSASCGGPGTLRAQGSVDPTAGAPKSQTLVAAFSAGPNGVVNSTCSNYVNATTATFTCAGDDICSSYTYGEAAKSIPGIWHVKDGASDTIQTSKNLEVGANITINAASGDAAFSTLSSTDKMIATGGLILGLDDTITLCDSTQSGKIRYHDDTTAVEVCDGAGNWVVLGNKGTGGAESEWTTDGSGNIYYTGGRVSMSTATPSGGNLLKMTANGRSMQLYSYSNTAANGASLDLYHARGTLALPANLSTGDETGVMNFYGYDSAGALWKKGGLISSTTQSSSGNGQINFAVGSPTDTLPIGLIVDSTGNMTVGATRGTNTLNINNSNGLLKMVSYNDGNPDNGSIVRLVRSRGTDALPTVDSTSDMIGALTWQGYDGNAYQSAAAINFLAKGTITSTALPIDLIIQNSPAGTAMPGNINSNILRYRGTGSDGTAAGIGIPTPVDSLQVAGQMRIVETSSPAEANNLYRGGVYPNQSKTMVFVPPAAYWNMGLAETEYSAVAPHGFGSLAVGVSCGAYAPYSTCIAASTADASGTNRSINAAAIGSISFNADGLTLRSPYTTIIGGLTNTSGDDSGQWAGQAATGNKLEGLGDTYILRSTLTRTGTSSQYAFTAGAANTSLNCTYCYALGENTYITGGSYNMGINLGTAIMTMSQSNTLAIMNGYVGVGTDSPSTSYALQVVGTTARLDGFSDWGATSDGRLKNIDGPYKKGLSALRQLHPVTFTYKKDNPDGMDPYTKHIGFIAQAVQTVFPEAVGQRKDGYLDIDMASIDVAKINAVKELNAEQKALMAEQKQLLDEQHDLITQYDDLRRRTNALLDRAGLPRGFGTGNLLGGLAIPLFGFAAGQLLGYRRRNQTKGR